MLLFRIVCFNVEFVFRWASFELISALEVERFRLLFINFPFAQFVKSSMFGVFLWVDLSWLFSLRFFGFWWTDCGHSFSIILGAAFKWRWLFDGDASLLLDCSDILLSVLAVRIKSKLLLRSLLTDKCSNLNQIN